MAKLSHNIEYVFALIGVKLVHLLSPRMADAFGARLGSVAHLLLPSRRRIARDNLRRAMGETLTEDEIHDIVKRVFQNIGRTLVEFARFGKIRPEGARRIIIGEGLEYLQKVHDEGKGAVVLTAHFGNWELLGSWIAAVGYPVDFLVGTQHNQKIDNLFNNFRREMGVGIIPLKTSIRGVFKSLKANRIAAIVADQHAHSGGVTIDFFGRKAATPKGPAAFAVRANCPMIPFLMRRERYDRHVIEAGQPIYPPNSGDDEKDIEAMTIAYTKFFEEGIRKYPDQWMWTHRRWKL
ncbi:MAG: lysophospholipid acyltransferase family protein [Candidatus Zixiibacteriota bacterium]